MIKHVKYENKLEVVREGFDCKTCWVQARAGAIPGKIPTIVMTAQKLRLTGSDVFRELNEFRSDDLGENWDGPIPHVKTLGPRSEPGGITAQPNDFSPKWHAHSGVLLGTGHVARYINDDLMPVPRPRNISYSSYNPELRIWKEWATVDLPEGGRFFSCGAGSSQRFDLEDGMILLPIYMRTKEETAYVSAVFKCEFDGEILRYVEHGSEISAPPGTRGMGEPSLTRFQDKFYLTMRNDNCGYVATSEDGLFYDESVVWCFDDGEELGNYNTQQHWVTRHDALFLVYTRRGANNDHVMRHRAPLFMAQVNPETLQIIRATERIIVPEKGARLGNFMVTDINENETWITVTEWMQTTAPNPYDYTVCQRYGANNRVYTSRIIWKTPNKLMSC